MDRQFIRDLIDGVRHYRESKQVELLNELVEIEKHGQTPKALFITCSDTRFSPQDITSSKPGVLFVHRNIGAIVPPYSPFSRSVLFDAVVEYAVEILNVRHIIVCGHTSCGAAKTLLNLDKLDSQSRLKEWLQYVEQVPGIVRSGTADNEKKMHDMAELLIVKASLENLTTYDCIIKRVREGNLFLIGWRYNLLEMSVEVYDKNSDDFVSENDFLKTLE